MVGQIEILEVAVERYKNLERVRVEWGPRVAVYGQNGSGKTNLLEAIALALGSRATTWQLADRAVLPLPGSIAITMRTTARQLPIPPVLSLRNGEKIGTATGPASERRLFDSGVFWEALGVERGENWSGALHSGILDARLARLLAAQETAPIIRYRLQAVEGLKEARDCDRGRPDDGSRDPADVTFSRRFARTLCLWKDDVADWLVEMAPELPDSFAPFRRWLAEPTDVRSPVADVLELPPATSAPAHVVWLQAARTDGEAYFDLRDASERAYRPLESLLMELHWMLDSPAADYGDEWELAIEQQTEFILSDLAAEIVRDTVKPVTPELDTTVITDGIGAVTVFSSQHGTEGRLPDLDVFRRLSSGQRAWVDIGLSRAAAEIDRLGTEIGGLLTAFQFPRFTDEASGRRAELVGEIEQAALDDDLEMLELGYLSTHDFKVVLSILRGHFGNPERIVERLGDMLSDLGADVSAQPSLRLAAETGFEEALDRRLVIHMLDEPERHLHPIAQRQVARSLADQHDGVAVVVASHSHYFLGSPGWMHLHSAKTPEGTIFTRFDPTELTVLSAVSREMGLTGGELLTRFRYILFVEGRADEAVLRGLYGPLFDDVGILILPISGIDEVKSLAELKIVGQLMDVGCGLLADHARRAQIDKQAKGRRTKEEQAFMELRRLLRPRGRKMDFFGLEQEDIIAYLGEDELASATPTFKTWSDPSLAPVSRSGW